MRLVLLAPLAASLALSLPWRPVQVSGRECAGSRRPPSATIKLGGRTGIEGPWRRALSLKLKRGGIPVSFSVCAVWGEPPTLTPECLQNSDERLPEGTQMRLEQHRTRGLEAGRALPGADAPRRVEQRRGGKSIRDGLLPRDAAGKGNGQDPADVEQVQGRLAQIGRQRQAERHDLRRRSFLSLIPAPKSTRSPTTAGHAFMPARIRSCQTSFPSSTANA